MRSQSVAKTSELQVTVQIYSAWPVYLCASKTLHVLCQPPAVFTGPGQHMNCLVGPAGLVCTASRAKLSVSHWIRAHECTTGSK
eukprot:COSAG03_NODE_1478_length_4016_cov_1.825632_2_plen_84_part_00